MNKHKFNSNGHDKKIFDKFCSIASNFSEYTLLEFIIEKWCDDNDIKDITESINNNFLYPRRCDITGEGMNEGYCIQDGLMYIKYEKDLIKHLREIETDANEGEHYSSDDFLLQDYYDAHYYYYTDWCELDGDVNYTIDGKEIFA